MKNKAGFLTFIGLILVTGGFGAGFLFAKSQGIFIVNPPENFDFSLFWEARQKIQDKFVDPAKITSTSVLYGAISGMVQKLGDPYTVFFAPEETKKFLDDVGGRFEGVGMEVGIRKGQLQVISPLEGSPAKKAGILPGDKILKIGDRETSAFSIDEAINLIRGTKGTQVTLLIGRENFSEPKEFKITRDVIEVPSLSWEIKDEKIGYIKIHQFSERAGYEFSKAAVSSINAGAERFIIDLRNNPGGYLSVAQDIAGWFLEKGKIVVIEDFSATGKKEIYKAEGNAGLKRFPVVVLINEGSASASEILAGALRDNRGIQLIGEKSFGKGSVQELEKLKGGGSLKITVAKWLTPNGNLISEIGLAPDIKVEMTTEDYEENRDPQLEKAIEIIKKIQ